MGLTETPTPPRPSYVAAVVAGSFTALLWAIEAIDSVMGHSLDREGIEPRDADGLVGILFAPLLHANWEHLIANTIPVLVLGFLALLTGLMRGLAATAIIWVVGGLGTWLTGNNGYTIGASGLIFGWITYLLVQGFFTRKFGHVLIGLAVFALYGSALWGVLPSMPGISWQGHLFGAIAGVLAAWWLRPQRVPRPSFER